MEVFLLSLTSLLIVALLVFLVLPRLGAQVLVILSLVLLVFCIYNHYKLFASEYRFSTWQEQLKWYAPVVTYVVITIFIFLYLGYLFSSQGSSILPTTNLSPSALASVTTTANNTVSSITNSLGITNKKNNTLMNLGGILNSPKRNNQSIL